LRKKTSYLAEYIKVCLGFSAFTTLSREGVQNIRDSAVANQFVWPEPTKKEPLRSAYLLVF
jgi:hypothetical protein